MEMGMLVGVATLRPNYIQLMILSFRKPTVPHVRPFVTSAETKDFGAFQEASRPIFILDKGFLR